VIAVLAAAVFTRYDGWILAALVWLAMAISLAVRGRLLKLRFVVASAALLAAPVAWMVYNQVLFGDWLDFMRGPYSARAIEMKTAVGSGPPHPGWHNPWVSFLFFGKAAEMDAVAAGFGWVLWLMMVVAADWAWRQRTRVAAGEDSTSRTGPLWTLFLWLPLPFYAYAVSWGSVPIFLPVWWPHSFYNTRYGLELLPALALFLGFLEEAGSMRAHHPRLDRAVTVVLFAAVLASSGAMLVEGPLVYEEGLRNAQARAGYNQELSAALAHLREADAHAAVLMDTSTFPSIVPMAGMVYRDTINESDKQFYESALAAPAEHVDAVLGFDGDAVSAAAAAHPAGLRVCGRFMAVGQRPATLWVTRQVPSAGCMEAGL
jgi:hypothetical protein